MTGNNTIAAIATAQGAGGIGIIRISGPEARGLLSRLFSPVQGNREGKEGSVFRPWMLHRGRVLDAGGKILDDALAVFMPGPKTFTGEDVVELHCHGGPVLLETVLESCLDAGARLADRGEFTRRAFLNGRMDLTQAEAVAEMIAAPSREGVRLAAARLDGMIGQRIRGLREKLEGLRAQICLAVDFPEEEAGSLLQETFMKGVEEVMRSVTELLTGFERARCWREGITVALAGSVNAGKSSLMNALLGRERAIVTAHPGTTRDFLEETVRFAGLPARLIDTAGLRDTDNPAEAEGIRMGRERIDAADVVLLLVDGATGMTPETEQLLETMGAERIVLIWSKSDLASPPPEWYSIRCDCVAKPASALVVSSKTGEGLDELAETVRALALTRSQSPEEPDEVVPNLRQAHCLKAAREELLALIEDIQGGIPYDLCAVRLEGAAATLASITGLDTPDDVLNRIFASFCIGK